MNEERLVDLETRLAYQDDLLEQLNQVVADQGHRIAELEKLVGLLSGRYRELADSVERLSPHEDAPPPHY